MQERPHVSERGPVKGRPSVESGLRQGEKRVFRGWGG